MSVVSLRKTSIENVTYWFCFQLLWVPSSFMIIHVWEEIWKTFSNLLQMKPCLPISNHEPTTPIIYFKRKINQQKKLPLSIHNPPPCSTSIPTIVYLLQYTPIPLYPSPKHTLQSGIIAVGYRVPENITTRSKRQFSA